MKKIKGKYFIVILLLLMEFISLTLMYKSSHNKEVVLDEVKLKELIKNDMISIMTDETGNGTYTEYSGNTFPSSGYVYNANKSQCINEKGDIVTGVLTYNGTKASLTSNEGMHCTLYFDKNCSGPTGTVLSGKAGISDCQVGGMYRYQGTNVNNYICFGTNNKSTCTSSNGKYKYLYQIIGITTDGSMKLILADLLREPDGSLTRESWGYYDNECSATPSKCNWNGSYLYNSLNGIDYKNGGSFINNSYYAYLNNNTWKTLINENYSWKYGEISDESKITYNGTEMYNIENAFVNTVKGAIAVPYIHDYLLAYPGGNPGNVTTASQCWINKILLSNDPAINNGYAFWTMTKKANENDNGNILARSYMIHNLVGINNDHSDPVIFTRPTFFLKNSIKIQSGSGSQSDPYIIAGMPEEIDNPPKINSITTENVNAHSIKISVSASDDKRVSNYCYAIQKGSNVNVTSTETCGDSTKEFTGLDQSTAYTIKVRVVDSANQEATDKRTISTNTLSCSFDLTYKSGQITLNLTYPNTVSSYKINSTSGKTLTIPYNTTETYNGEITDSSGNVATCSVKIQGKTSSGYCLSCGSGSSTGGASGGFAAFFSTSKECDEYRSQYSGSSGGATWGGSCLCNSCTGCASDYTLILDSTNNSNYDLARCYKVTS